MSKRSKYNWHLSVWFWS